MAPLVPSEEDIACLAVLAKNKLHLSSQTCKKHHLVRLHSSKLASGFGCVNVLGFSFKADILPEMFHTVSSCSRWRSSRLRLKLVPQLFRHGTSCACASSLSFSLSPQIISHLRLVLFLPCEKCLHARNTTYSVTGCAKHA